ncbi:hypothetical protein [Paractinoplanes toevensis]|uniref:N-acetyltransferase domain-containing protein n=1 Tax=Paractinoplanes toevensis TaxID=571911 RepID=A0A919T4S7_9ACTN|nr:hypothetical protein [Actinoplanes toevensis]GIM89040.1 hypothetical protein Ato02nite_008330 [Actinoplanes toevensis]
MTYDLAASTVRLRTAAALAAHPSAGRFVALAVGAASPMADVARDLERQVFEKSFGNDAGQMAAEYRRYEDDSLFFIVLDRKTGMPAGAGRVIDSGGKTLDDAPGRIDTPLSAIVALHNLGNGRIWDFATLAVLPAYRGGRSGLAVSSLLYRTFLNAGRLAGVRHVVAMLDHRAHRNMKLIGVHFAAMAGSEPFAYLGSPATEALYVPFAELIPSIGRQAQRLGRLTGQFHGEIRARGVRRLVTRRIAARVAGQIATGDGLDEHITLPGLDRRQLIRQR